MMSLKYDKLKAEHLYFFFRTSNFPFDAKYIFVFLYFFPSFLLSFFPSFLLSFFPSFLSFPFLSFPFFIYFSLITICVLNLVVCCDWVGEFKAFFDFILILTLLLF